MEIIKSLWFKLSASPLAALLINLLILFIIPPTTTLGIKIKDIISLIVFGIIYFNLLKDD